MDDKEIAKQLRKPEGANGIKTAKMLCVSNEFICKKSYDLLAPCENDKILEIGFADAVFLPHLNSKVNSFVYKGIDISQDMVDEARNRKYNFGDNVSTEFLLGSSSKIEFPDNYFDKILSANTIYFWDSPRRDASEIYRVLKPGGKLVISLRPYYKMEKLGFMKYGFSFYNEDELEVLFGDEGFNHFEFLQMEEPEKIFDGKTHKLYSMYMICKK